MRVFSVHDVYVVSGDMQQVETAFPGVCDAIGFYTSHGWETSDPELLGTVVAVVDEETGEVVATGRYHRQEGVDGPILIWTGSRLGGQPAQGWEWGYSRVTMDSGGYRPVPMNGKTPSIVDGVCRYYS
jgi:hypothetical protein